MALNYNAAVNISAQFTGQNAVNQAKNSFASLDSAISKISTGLKGLAGLYAGKQVYDYAKGIIDLGDHLNDLSTTTGLSVETLDSLKGAAEENGIAFDQLETGLKKFTSNLALHQKEFESIGIYTKDANKAFLELSDRFAQLPGSTERAALAIKVFGKSGTDMVRVMTEGSAALKEFGSGFTTDFARRADELNDRLSSIKRQANALSVEALSHLLPAFKQIADAFFKLEKQQGGGGKVFDDIADGIRIASVAMVGFVELIANGVDAIITSFRELGSYVAQFGAAAANGFRNNDQGRAVQQAAEEDRRQLLLDLAKRSEDRKNNVLNFAKDALKDIGNPNQALLDTAPKAKGKGGGTADLGEFSEQLKKYQDAIKTLEAEQDKQIEMNALEREKLDLTTAAYEKKKIAIEQNLATSKAIQGFTETQKKNYIDEANALVELKQALVDYNEAQKESFGVGAQQAFKEYLESARDVAAQTKALFTHVFSGLEDAIVQFVKTGKLSFASLADAIETDLIRIAVRQTLVAGLSGVGALFASAIAGAAGGAAGGGGGSVSTGGNSYFHAGSAHGNIVGYEGIYPLRKYAAGGIAHAPMVSLFGEGSTPEAYVPLQDGRSIPVTLRGAGGGGGNTSVVVNVHTSGGSGDSDVVSDTEKGKQLGRMMASVARDAIIREQRPGGLLSG